MQGKVATIRLKQQRVRDLDPFRASVIQAATTRELLGMLCQFLVCALSGQVVGAAFTLRGLQGTEA